MEDFYWFIDDTYSIIIFGGGAFILSHILQWLFLKFINPKTWKEIVYNKKSINYEKTTPKLLNKKRYRSNKNTYEYKSILDKLNDKK